jgi:peptidoglycan hydrolase CwlO-like protein
MDTTKFVRSSGIPIGIALTLLTLVAGAVLVYGEGMERIAKVETAQAQHQQTAKESVAELNHAVGTVDDKLDANKQEITKVQVSQEHIASDVEELKADLKEALRLLRSQ